MDVGDIPLIQAEQGLAVSPSITLKVNRTQDLITQYPENTKVVGATGGIIGI
jgi:hypothetical protein